MPNDVYYLSTEILVHKFTKNRNNYRNQKDTKGGGGGGREGGPPTQIHSFSENWPNNWWILPKGIGAFFWNSWIRHSSLKIKEAVR